MTVDELIEKLQSLTPEQRALQVDCPSEECGYSSVAIVCEHKYDDRPYLTHTEPGERVIILEPEQKPAPCSSR